MDEMNPFVVFNPEIEIRVIDPEFIDPGQFEPKYTVYKIVGNYIKLFLYNLYR